jgi:uncharacterized membrane protein YdjX (TVP38/TMEM64 family)
MHANISVRIWQLMRSVINWRTIGVFVLALLVAVAFLYFDRRDSISIAIRSWGPVGVIAAIVIMTALCMTPIPSEGLLVMYMKIYGSWWGVVYGWTGATLSSVVIYILARRFGPPIVHRYLPRERFEQVDEWVKSKGVLGLLIARLLPIPAFAINYVAGVIPSIGFWPYLWTAAVSMIPYYTGAAFIFLGLSTRLTIWLIVGGITILLFWLAGYVANRHK